MPKIKSKRRSSKSGFTGVVLNGCGGGPWVADMEKEGKKYKKYVARIYIDQNIKYLGSYDTAEQAAEAYDKEAIKLRLPFSKLNFPKKAPVGYTPIQRSRRSTIGYRGVSKRGKKFQACTQIGGKYNYIGTFDTAKEAAVAYDRVALKANRSTTLLNFPDMVHNLDVEPKQKVKSATGYKGVVKYGKAGKFKTRLYTNGNNKSIGIFDTAIQAALAYDQAAIKKGNKKSTLNFPDGLPLPLPIHAWV